MTSLIQVSDSNAIVYISSTKYFGQLNTIRDIGGARNTSNTISISTTGTFSDGTNLRTIDTPYASITISPSTSQIMHQFPFTYGQSVNVTSLTGQSHFDIYVSTNIYDSLYVANTISSSGAVDAMNIFIACNVATRVTDMVSTITHLGQIYTSTTYIPIASLRSNGYIVGSDLVSTVTGGFPYISTQAYESTLQTLSNFISGPNLTSTVSGLGSTYISSQTLLSTVQGLASPPFGYISTSWLTSTVTSLQSSLYGTGASYMYISTNSGLASVGYISTTQLTSTLQGLGSSYISGGLQSTVNNLGGFDVGFVATTFAGTGSNGLVNGSNAAFSYPAGIATDGAGNVYVADTSNNAIRRVDIYGNVMTVANSFTRPSAVAVFNSNIYVADTGNNRIRRIDAFSNVTTYAGTGAVGSANGVALSATFNGPLGLTIDAVGNLYVADTGNNVIRKIDTFSNVTTFAGSGVAGSNDGTGTATFSSPAGLVIDFFANIYVADTENNSIRKIDAAGNVTTYATGFVQPTAITYDANYLYVADATTIRKIDSNGVMVVAGSTLGFVNGLGSNAKFNRPQGIAMYGTTIYVADAGNNVLRQLVPASPTKLLSTVQGLGSIYITHLSLLSATDAALNVPRGTGGIVTTFAGNGSIGFADGPASNASFSLPGGVVVDSVGNVYVGDIVNNRIRKISGGIVSTFAGTGLHGFADGPLLSASFRYPYGLAIDSADNLYVADQLNNRIRFISGGQVTTFAGTGAQGSANGPALSASFNKPIQLLLDSSNVYVADQDNNMIRLISGGQVTTFAGSGAQGTANGPALSASFNRPGGLALFSSNIYVADTNNHRIRLISGGQVTTFAGNVNGFANGALLSASFFYPGALAFFSSNLYVCDRLNRRIRLISGGQVTTFTGTGVYTPIINGPLSNATFNDLTSITFDSRANIYLTDGNHCTIRKIASPTPAPKGFVVMSELVSTNQGLGMYYISTPSIQSTLTAFGSGSTANLTSTIDGLVPAVVAPQVISYFLAGSLQPGENNGLATSASFSYPEGVAVYLSNVYVADTGNNKIRLISGGQVTTFAGGPQGFADGPLLNARFNTPTGIAIDSVGNIYVADRNNYRIRLISGGQVTTFAGDGLSGFLNGPALNARFDSPYAIAVYSSNVYVSDNTPKIRLISGGQVTTFAGDVQGFADGPIGSALFNNIQGLAVDSSNVYVSDNGNKRIRQISGGQVTTLITNFYLYNLKGIAVDLSGNVYFSEYAFYKNILRISGGQLTIVIQPNFSAPIGVAVDASANIYVTDCGIRFIGKPPPRISTYIDRTQLTSTCQGLGSYYISSFIYGGYSTSNDLATASSNEQIQYSNILISSLIQYTSTVNGLAPVVPQPIVTTLAGNGLSSPIVNGPALNATFNNPTGVAVYGSNVYVADQYNSMIRLISGGQVTTFAGNGNTTPFTDGPTTNATFFRPYAIAVDSSGSVYVADTYNHRIRRISGGQVSTIAGDGVARFVNGSVASASFNYPYAIAVDSTGNIYVADTDNNRIRLISGGQVTTFAGNGTGAFTDGPVANASFNGPYGVAVDSAGNVFVADTGNHRIRLISGGQVTTLAGNGATTYADGPALNASIRFPYGVAVYGSSVYASATNRIRLISGGQVTTLAGSGVGFPFADGIGSNASFLNPHGLAVDLSGNIYVAENGFSKIRLITLPATTSTSITLSNALSNVVASLPAYPSQTTASMVATSVANMASIYTNGQVGPSQYMKVNSSLDTRNLYTFCNATAYAFYASNANGTNGSFYADGTLLTSSSDRRLKKDIVQMSNALEKIQALAGVYYTRKDDPNHARNIGFLAQDVETVFPDLVFTDHSPMQQKSIKYESINVALLEAIKELDIECDALLSEVVKLNS